MKLKTALEVLNGLMELDGYVNGAGPAKTPYKFDGATRMAIARARRTLRQLQEDYVEARNQMILQLTDGHGELPPLNQPPFDPELRAKHVAFAKYDRELLLAKVDVKLAPFFTESALNLEENPIPPSVLDLIWPLLEESAS